MILGDSVTFGYELPQNAAYPKQLEAMLNRYAPPGAPTYEVLNLGVTGYNATQIGEVLRVKGLRFEPDLIVYGYVLNDPQAYSVEQEALDILAAQASKRQGVSRFLPRFRLLPLLAKHFTELRVNRLPFSLHDPGFVAYEGETHREHFFALSR